MPTLATLDFFDISRTPANGYVFTVAKYNVTTRHARTPYIHIDAHTQSTPVSAREPDTQEGAFTFPLQDDTISSGLEVSRSTNLGASSRLHQGPSHHDYFDGHSQVRQGGEGEGQAGSFPSSTDAFPAIRQRRDGIHMMTSLKLCKIHRFIHFRIKQGVFSFSTARELKSKVETAVKVYCDALRVDTPKRESHQDQDQMGTQLEALTQDKDDPLQFTLMMVRGGGKWEDKAALTQWRESFQQHCGTLCAHHLPQFVELRSERSARNVPTGP